MNITSAYCLQDELGNDVSIIIVEDEKMLSIPLDPANRHYQGVLDAIIEQGADCFDGDIPEDLQAAADAKLAAGLYQPDPHA